MAAGAAQTKAETLKKFAADDKSPLLALGMTRAAAKKLLGTPTEEDMSGTSGQIGFEIGKRDVTCQIEFGVVQFVILEGYAKQSDFQTALKELGIKETLVKKATLVGPKKDLVAVGSASKSIDLEWHEQDGKFDLVASLHK